MKYLEQPKTSIAHFIIHTLRPFHWQTVGLIVVACYWSIHVSLQPYVIKLILDQISLNPSFSNIITPIIFYITLSFVYTLNFRFYDYVCLKFYPQLKANIIQDATNTISHYPYAFFQNQFSGGLTDKIKNLSKGTAEIIEIIFDRFLSHLLALCVAFGTLMTVSPLLSLVFLSWALFLIILGFMTSKKARFLSHEFSGAVSHVIGRLVDRFTNILNVRLFTAYKHEDTLLHKDLQATIQHDRNLRWYLLKLMAIQGFATATMISGCLLVLIFAVQSHRITIGEFGLVLTLTIAFSDIMWNFSKEISKFSEVYGMVSQGLILLKPKSELKDSPQAKTLSIKQGEIRFQQVHFQYANAEPLFSDKSITLQAGQKVGLVGYSGSGKSTFVSLILRLFDVNSGQILIDGQNIREVTQDSLHQAIGMIPQEPTLFHRTLQENIRYGRLTANDEEVITAAKKAHAHEFIETLPDKYHTLVGERGIKLSGGQRQRIAIARAILKNAPLLLLDEATSALDSVTETLIKDSLMDLMKDKTTIVIAHRLSTLLHMDRILVFHKGKIVEDGTHAELLKQEDYYKSLWDAQVGGFIPEKDSQIDK